MPDHREQTTVIVSVNAELDEDARFEQISRQVGQGWRVLSAIPLSGGGLGPGGESEHFLRLQVHLERTIDEDNVIVNERPAEADEAFRFSDAGPTPSEQRQAADNTPGTRIPEDPR